MNEAGRVHFKNTSRYRHDEAFELVGFALDGIDHAHLAVHLKNSRYKYRGRADDGVPAASPGES